MISISITSLLRLVAYSVTISIEFFEMFNTKESTDLQNKNASFVALVAEVVRILQDYVIERLRKIEGLKAFEPEGAFYVFADATKFFGPDVQAKDFGAVPDADALCRSAHLGLH